MSKREAFQVSHLWSTLLFVAILVTNHRLGWNLTPFEVGTLAAVLGVHMGLKQAAAITRFKSLVSSDPSPTPEASNATNPSPAPPAA